MEQNNLINSIDEQTLDDIFNFVYGRFISLKQQRDDQDAIVLDDIKKYNSIPEQDKEEWEANYFVPYTFEIIKAVYPRLYYSLFGEDKWITATPNSEEEVGKSQAMTTWILRFLEAVGMKKKSKQIIKAALIYPNVVVKEFFDKNTKLPNFKLIDYFDYWQDISYSTIEDAPDRIVRKVLNGSQVKTRFNNGYYSHKDVNSVLESSMDTDIADLQATALGYFLDNSYEKTVAQTDKEKKNLGLYEVLEYYGLYDIDGDGINEDVIFTIINRRFLVRITKNENNRPPFVLFQTDIEPIGFYPKSYVRALKPAQKTLNDIVDNRFDNLNLILNKMFKVRRNTYLDFDELFAAPGQTVVVDEMEDVQEFRISNIISDSYKQEELTRRDMDTMSGMFNMAGIGSDTATMGQIYTNEAMTRYREPLDLLAESFIKLIKDLLILAKDYADEITMLRVKSIDESTIFDLTKEDIRNDYSLKINFKTFMPNKQKVVQDLVMLLNVVGQLPGINVKAYVKNIFDMLDEVKNPEEIFQETPAQPNAPVQVSKSAGELQDVNPVNPMLEVSKAGDLSPIEKKLGLE